MASSANVNYPAAPAAPTGNVTDFDVQAADLARRKRLAEMLQQQALQPLNLKGNNGYAQPLSQIFQAWAGKSSADDVAAQEKQLNADKNTALAGWLTRAPQGTPAVQGNPGAPETGGPGGEDMGGPAPVTHSQAATPPSAGDLMKWGIEGGNYGAFGQHVAEDTVKGALAQMLKKGGTGKLETVFHNGNEVKAMVDGDGNIMRYVGDDKGQVPGSQQKYYEFLKGKGVSDADALSMVQNAKQFISGGDGSIYATDKASLYPGTYGQGGPMAPEITQVAGAGTGAKPPPMLPPPPGAAATSPPPPPAPPMLPAAGYMDKLLTVRKEAAAAPESATRTENLARIDDEISKQPKPAAPLTGPYAAPATVPGSGVQRMSTQNTKGENALTTDVEQYGKMLRTTNIPQLDTALTRVEKMLEKYTDKSDSANPKDKPIPGVGIIQNALPGLTQDAQDNQNIIRQLRGIKITGEAGKSQTKSEIENVLNELGTSTFQSEKTFRNAVPKLREALSRVTSEVNASYDPQVLKRYSERKKTGDDAPRSYQDIMDGK